VNIKDKIHFILVVLVVGLLCLNHYLTGSFKTGVFFNSDSLYVPQLIEDLRLSFSNINHWNLSRAPSFFDITVFYIIRQIFSGHLSIAVFFMVQIALTSLILFHVYSKKYTKEFSVSLVALVLFGLFYVLQKDVSSYLVILKSAHHFSVYLVWLVLSLLLLRYFQDFNRKRLILIYVISFLQALSDQLILLHFVAPAIVFGCLYLLLHRSQYKQVILFITGLGLVSLFSLWVSTHFHQVQESVSSLTPGVESIKNDFQRLVQLFIKLNSFSLVVLGSTLIFWIHFINEIVSSKRIRDDQMYFLMVVFVSLFVLLLIPGKNMLFRYLMPVFFTPLLFYLFVIPRSMQDSMKGALNVATVLVLAVLIILAPKGEWRDEFYPDHVRCVDESLSQMEIKFLAGGFWDGRHYTFLSQKGIRIQPFYNDFSIDQRVSNRSLTPQYYSGFLIDTKNNKGLNQDQVIEQFGTPVKVIKCSNANLIVYNKNSLVIGPKGTLIKK
jgi:hypothetical protein